MPTNQAKSTGVVTESIEISVTHHCPSSPDKCACVAPLAKRKVGRPPKPDALTQAERARRYRQRKAARLAELRDETQPLRSRVIDLSALPAWKVRP